MADEQTAIETSATDTNPASETPAGAATETPTVESLIAERERMTIALASANKEAKDRRLKLTALEKAETERKKAAMTDLEKAQTERADFEKRYQELSANYDGLRLRQSFFDAVATAGVEFASDQARADAYNLADLTAALDGGEVQPKALTTAIKALQTSRPYLFGQAAKPPDIGATERGGDDGLPEVTDEEIQEFAARMSIPVQYIDKRALAQMKRLDSKGN